MNNDLLILLDHFAVESMKALVIAKYPATPQDVPRMTNLAYEIARSMLREHLKLDSAE